MPWLNEELTQRFPVWDVLSEFWLDGWLDDSDHARIATQLKASPYSKEQLLSICIYEVAPAVSTNLLSIAGEWGGFDQEWLRKKIIKKSPDSSGYLTPSLWRKFRGLMYRSHIESSGWNKIIRS